MQLFLARSVSLVEIVLVPIINQLNNRCPKCPKAYTTLRAMKNHATSHTETKVVTPPIAPPKNAKCSVCGDSFAEVSNIVSISTIFAGIYLKLSYVHPTQRPHMQTATTWIELKRK